MPSYHVQTDQELFFIGSNRMQLMELTTGQLLGEAVKATGWDVTIERDTTLNQSFSTRSEAGQYLIQNGADPEAGGRSTFHPNFDDYTD